MPLRLVSGLRQFDFLFPKASDVNQKVQREIIDALTVHFEEPAMLSSITFGRRLDKFRANLRA